MNRRHSALAAEVEENYTLALGRVRFVELSDEYLSKRVPNEGELLRCTTNMPVYPQLTL
jgi:hypothetical protein